MHIPLEESLRHGQETLTQCPAELQSSVDSIASEGAMQILLHYGLPGSLDGGGNSLDIQLRPYSESPQLV